MKEQRTKCDDCKWSEAAWDGKLMCNENKVGLAIGGWPFASYARTVLPCGPDFKLFKPKERRV